jgi:hypothetical protein
MNTPVLWVTRLYAAILRLYPPEFRQELGAEMQTVFQQVAIDAQRKGWLSLLFVCWRELRDLPGSLAEAHRSHPQGGFRMETMDYPRLFGDPGSPPNEVEPYPWREVLLGAIFFPLFILALISDVWARYDFNPGINPKTFGTLLAIIVLGLILAFLVLGAYRKFPDWSLPYVGFVVAILSALVLLTINHAQPTLLIGILFFLSPSLAILISRWIKPLRSLWQTVWLDPTRINFIYMGLMVLAYMLVLDDVPFEEFVVSFCILLMIPFAIFYMRSRRLWQRVLIPPIGFLVAWTFSLFYSFDLFHRPFWFGWHGGVGVLIRIGLAILAWFLLPGVWILLRRVKWIAPSEV